MRTECSAGDVPPGYKQTEAGVIPEDWETVKLSQVSAFITKGSTPTTYGFKWEDSGVLFFRSECVSEFGLDLKQSMFISEAANSLLRRSEVSDGDILITITGNVGRVILLSGINHANINQHIARVRIISPDIVPSYVFHFLSQSSIRNRFNTITTGQAYPQISLKQVREAEISIPPTKAEQEAIAESLSDADALIESLEQLIAKKRQIKQGAMQELLTGKRRLPEFTTTDGYKHTDVGVIPEDWDCIAIGNSIDLLTGFPFPSAGYSKSGIRLLRGSNVKRGFTDWSEEGTEFWPTITSEIRKYELKAGDIVIAMDGSLVGRSFAMLSESDVPSVLLQRVARIRSESIEQKFLKAWICSQRFTEHCDSVKTVTAIPHISPADIKSFKVALPPTEAEQEAIASILSDMDSEITMLEEKLAKARQIKQGMMQELLTGRICLL